MSRATSSKRSLSPSILNGEPISFPDEEPPPKKKLIYHTTDSELSISTNLDTKPAAKSSKSKFKDLFAKNKITDPSERLTSSKILSKHSSPSKKKLSTSSHRGSSSRHGERIKARNPVASRRNNKTHQSVFRKPPAKSLDPNRSSSYQYSSTSFVDARESKQKTKFNGSNIGKIEKNSEPQPHTENSIASLESWKAMTQHFLDKTTTHLVNKIVANNPKSVNVPIQLNERSSIIAKHSVKPPVRTPSSMKRKPKKSSKHEKNDSASLNQNRSPMLRASNWKSSKIFECMKEHEVSIESSSVSSGKYSDSLHDHKEQPSPPINNSSNFRIEESFRYPCELESDPTELIQQNKPSSDPCEPDCNNFSMVFPAPDDSPANEESYRNDRLVVGSSCPDNLPYGLPPAELERALPCYNQGYVSESSVHGLPQNQQQNSFVYQTHESTEQGNATVGHLTEEEHRQDTMTQEEIDERKFWENIAEIGFTAQYYMETECEEVMTHLKPGKISKIKPEDKGRPKPEKIKSKAEENTRSNKKKSAPSKPDERKKSRPDKETKSKSLEQTKSKSETKSKPKPRQQTEAAPEKKNEEIETAAKDSMRSPMLNVKSSSASIRANKWSKAGWIVTTDEQPNKGNSLDTASRKDDEREDVFLERCQFVKPSPEPEIPVVLKPFDREPARKVISIGPLKEQTSVALSKAAFQSSNTESHNEILPGCSKTASAGKPFHFNQSLQLPDRESLASAITALSNNGNFEGKKLTPSEAATVAAVIPELVQALLNPSTASTSLLNSSPSSNPVSNTPLDEIPLPPVKSTMKEPSVHVSKSSQNTKPTPQNLNITSAQPATASVSHLPTPIRCDQPQMIRCDPSIPPPPVPPVPPECPPPNFYPGPGPIFNPVAGLLPQIPPPFIDQAMCPPHPHTIHSSIHEILHQQLSQLFPSFPAMEVNSILSSGILQNNELLQKLLSTAHPANLVNMCPSGNDPVIAPAVHQNSADAELFNLMMKAKDHLDQPDDPSYAPPDPPPPHNSSQRSGQKPPVSLKQNKSQFIKAQGEKNSEQLKLTSTDAEESRLAPNDPCLHEKRKVVPSYDKKTALIKSYIQEKMKQNSIEDNPGNSTSFEAKISNDEKQNSTVKQNISEKYKQMAAIRAKKLKARKNRFQKPSKPKSVIVEANNISSVVPEANEPNAKLKSLSKRMDDLLSQDPTSLS